MSSNISRFQIQLTDAAREAATALQGEGKYIRFTVARSGCCSMSVKIYPDVERVTDQVIEVDGIRILIKDEYPELTWIGTIDYKGKGLHKGFSWR